MVRGPPARPVRTEPEYFNFSVAIGPSVDRGGDVEAADPSHCIIEYCGVTLGEGEESGRHGPLSGSSK